MELGEVDFTNCRQCIGSYAGLEILGQGLKPVLILALQCRELRDGLGPTFGASAVVDETPRPGDGDVGLSGGPISSLSLGDGHGSIGDEFARHSGSPIVT